MLSLACTDAAKDEAPNTEDTAVETPTGGDSASGDSDGGADSTPDTAADTAADTAEEVDSDTVIYDAPQIGEVTARLHEALRSLIYVEWEQLEAATVYVEFSVDDGDWRATPAVDAVGGPQSHLLLGVPYGAEVQYRVVNDFGAGPLAADAAAISADAAPEDMPQISAVSGDETLWDPDASYFFLSLTEPGRGSAAIGEDWWVMVLDRQGRVVWARETPLATSFHPRISHDGTDLLIDHATFWSLFDFGAASNIVRMKIDGTEVATYDTPGLHHPFTEIADGSIVWAAQDGNNETLEKLPAGGGPQERIWDCRAFVSPIDNRATCGSNALAWSEATDTFLFSLYTESTIFEIDHATGETLRYFGQLDGSWAFDPENTTFNWQHGGHYTEAGTLLVSTAENVWPGGMVLREFTVDEETQTLTEIWSLGVGEAIDSLYFGEPHRLGNGNTLQNTGDLPTMREALPDGTIVWEVSWHEDHWLGRSTPVADLYALAP